MLVDRQGVSIPIVSTRTACVRATHTPPPVATPDILFNKNTSDKLLAMPMPPETLKTLQDLEITGAGATGSQQQRRRRQQQQQQEDNTQHYEQPIENDGHAQGQQQLPAQTIHHHPHPTTAPHPAALQAHPSEQPHSAHIYPPLLDHHFAFDSDGTIPIDPGLLDARFDLPAASGHGGGGVPGFHQGHPEQQWAAAPQPLSSVHMDNFTVSPTSISQYPDPQAPLLPGMSSFEPQISTTWSMDGSLPSASTSASRGPAMSSSMSVPSTSTPASSKSPSSPGKVAAGLNNAPLAAKDFPQTSFPGVQLDSRAGDQPSKRRRQTAGGRETANMSTEKFRSHRNNSSPGLSTPQVPIAPAPLAGAATGDDNNKSINNRKGSSSSSSNNSSRHAEKTKTTTTRNASGPSGPSTRTTTSTATTAPGQAPDPRARNREAANRCRAKSKVAVAELEATEQALGSEHEHLTRTARSLRDEVLALKNELLMHGNCDDELIQQYLANSARMVGSGINTASMMTTTTTAAATTAGGTLGGGMGGIVGSSSHAMLSASPPRVLPTLLPSTSSGTSGVAGMTTPTTSTPTTTTTTTTTTARGRGSVGGRKP